MGDIADLTAKTYEIARLIPHGRVTTYGHIARLAGYPNYSRWVTWDDGTSPCIPVENLNSQACGERVENVTSRQHRPMAGQIPAVCAPRFPAYPQRVISSKGIISPRGDQGLGVARQRDRLEQEGVVVTTLAGAGGEKVDIRAYGWFPENVELDG